MIDMNNLSLSIGDKQILHDITLTVQRGEFFAVLGPNGSGKSTLLKAISKTLNTTDGHIWVDGKRLEHYKDRGYAKKVSALHQHNRAIEGITVYEMVAYGRIPHRRLFQMSSKQDHAIIMQALEEVDLLGYKDRPVLQLSGGELQRVFLAGSFAQEPSLLLLDEPTNHLDVKHQYGILSLVRRRVDTEGLTAFCVLHDINQAIRFAHSIALVKEGRLHYTGTPSEVLNEDAIFEIFGIKSKIHTDGAAPFVEFLP